MTYMATVRSRDTVLPYGLLFGAFEKQGGTCTSKRRSRCVDARGKDCTHYVHTILMLLDAAENMSRRGLPLRMGIQMRIRVAGMRFQQIGHHRFHNPKSHLVPLVLVVYCMYQPHAGSGRWSSDMSAISRCRVAHEPS